MLLKLLILTILLVAFLYLFYFKIENFISCPIDQVKDSIYRPINMIKSDIDKFNITGKSDYIDPNILLTMDELKSIITSIDKNRPIYIYKEIETPSYSYNKTHINNHIDSESSNIVDRLQGILKTYINEAIKKKNKCLDSDCYSILKKYTILRVGSSDNGTRMVEGQLLYSFHNRPIDFLIKYVISTENSLTIHSLDLDGYQFSSNVDHIDYPVESNLRFYRNPMIHSYNNGSDYNDHTVPGKVIVDAILTRREEEQKKDQKCYGKIALNKNECETEVDIYGKKLEVVGVWDSDCVNDYECPFFKANKNYPNTFGKCVLGKCEMPLGITQVSSKKYLNLDGAICSNCKVGNNCCTDQGRDKTQYSKLVTPDYRFDGDLEERNRHSLSFTETGLKVT